MKGLIVQIGTLQDLRANPASEFVTGFINASEGSRTGMRTCLVTCLGRPCRFVPFSAIRIIVGSKKFTESYVLAENPQNARSKTPASLSNIGRGWAAQSFCGKLFARDRSLFILNIPALSRIEKFSNARRSLRSMRSATKLAKRRIGISGELGFNKHTRS